MSIKDFIIKTPVLRKLFRKFITIETADTLVTKFTDSFTQVAAEQALNAKEAKARVRKAKTEQLAAEEEQARNELAAKNLTQLLTKKKG